MKLTRSYVLKIYPNYHKLEDLRYSSSRYKLYLQHFVTQLYYHPWIKEYSTKGMGSLANRAQRQAKGIVKKEMRSLELRNKSNCPQIHYDSCPATIEISNGTKFNYWINLTSPWRNKIKIPAKSYRKLNDKLRNNWKLSEYCEFFKSKTREWLVRVFVTKNIDRFNIKNKSLGIDVGIKHGVARSDKYLGKNLSNIIEKEKISQAERQRQHDKKKTFKTLVKQQLDKEVNLALARCKKDSMNLVVEHPKVLANLRINKLNRWARSYFANRAGVRANEEEIFIRWVNPAYTSQTCSNCGHIDKQSRVSQSLFVCTSCDFHSNADINAAINMARKGQERISTTLKFGEAPVEIFLKKEVASN